MGVLKLFPTGFSGVVKKRETLHNRPEFVEINWLFSSLGSELLMIIAEPSERKEQLHQHSF
jgi:hypothetical protein